MKCKVCNKETGILAGLNWGYIKWKSPLGEYVIEPICPLCGIKVNKRIRQLIKQIGVLKV